MAIQYKLRNTHTFNSQSNRLYIEDDTGNYDASTNPGGYGIPNINRADKALVIVGLYKSSKGSKLVGFDNYNPLTVSIFNAQIVADGWYEFHLLSLPIYNSALLSTYPIGSSYYDTITKLVITIVLNNNSLPSIVEADKMLLLGSSYEVAKSEDELVVASNTKIMIRLNSLINDLIVNKVDFYDKQLIRLKNNYGAVRGIIQGSLYEFARGNKAVAQDNLEFLNTNDYLKV